MLTLEVVFVYKKLVLLVLALMFMAFSNLRVCCRLTVDGEAVPGSFPRSRRILP